MAGSGLQTSEKNWRVVRVGLPLLRSLSSPQPSNFGFLAKKLGMACFLPRPAAKFRAHPPKSPWSDQTGRMRLTASLAPVPTSPRVGRGVAKVRDAWSALKESPVMPAPRRCYLSPRPGSLSCLLLVFATLIVLVAKPAKVAAQARSVPDLPYFGAIEELYRGEYRDANRAFTSNVRTAIKTVQSRWIDSICYHTMLGESLYQMGDNRAALVEFNAACDLFLSYPKWLLKVDFRDPRPESNPNRLNPPWGRPTRQAQVGIFNKTMLVSQGELLTEQRARQGGALQPLQNWPLNVVEVMRTTALSIRRRNEILGPLAPHDAMSKSLVAALNRGGNAPRNHWSNAWTELLLATAQHGVGEGQQAMTHYARALLVDGRYDHPLTGAALLGQAQLAMEAGNAQAALQLATEASYAAYPYDDYDIICEALRLGHIAFMASGGQGVYPALGPAAQWADRKGLDHISALCRIYEAEEIMLSTGDAGAASQRIGAINSRRRDLPTGRLGPYRRQVEGMIAYWGGNIDQGDKLVNEGLKQLASQSLRNFHVTLANERIDSGEVSSRIAVELYGLLLRDPTPRDWLVEPFDTLAHLTSAHEGAINRWLAAAFDRKDVLPALEITELAKRRRFWLAQPLGSRLVAIRNLLETSPERLTPASRVQRRNLLVKSPRYAALLEEDRALRAEIAREALVDAAGRTPSSQATRYKKLRDNLRQREMLLRQFVLRRDATDLDVPPRISGVELQKSLPPGRALLVFHQAGSNMFAFLIVAEGYHTWEVPNPDNLRDATSEMLRGLGNFSRQKTFTTKELESSDWRSTADPLANMLLDNSRLDLSKTTELIVVPDGVLWHVPFEILTPKIGGNTQMLVERAPIRYVPTASFGVGDFTPPRPVRNTVVIPATGSGSQDPLPTMLAESIREVVANPLPASGVSGVPTTLFASLVDQIVVLAEADLDPANPYALIPAPLDRTGGALGEWLRLPMVDCQRIILGGIHTAAEAGLKSRRRSARSGSGDSGIEGPELFHLSCSLLASGAKTALVSRWQTGGQTHSDLLREFIRELPNMPANQAWQRSVLLAQRTTLMPEQEPRFKRPSDGAEIPTAQHPILWAGYLLIDTGYDSSLEPQAPAAEEAADAPDALPGIAPGIPPAIAPGGVPPAAPGGAVPPVVNEPQPPAGPAPQPPAGDAPQPPAGEP